MKIAKNSRNSKLPPMHDFGVAVGKKPFIPENSYPSARCCTDQFYMKA
jgi:hypothetical protein